MPILLLPLGAPLGEGGGPGPGPGPSPGPSPEPEPTIGGGVVRTKRLPFLAMTAPDSLDAEDDLLLILTL